MSVNKNTKGYRTYRWWINREFGDLKVIGCSKEGACVGSQVSKIECVCECGNIISNIPNRLTGGTSTTCGKCNLIKKEDIPKYKSKLSILNFNKLAEELFYTSILKCKCSCGGLRSVGVGYYLKSTILSCGKCNLRSKKWWVGRKYGHLTVVGCPNTGVYKGSDVKLKCKCDCGNIVSVEARSLFRNTEYRSCGKCIKNYRSWWDTNNLTKSSDLSLLNLELFFSGFSITPLEDGKWSTITKFRCNLCNRIFKARLFDIVIGKQVSCGCIQKYSRISKMNVEVLNFVKELGFKAKLEHSMGRGFKIDVLVRLNKSDRLAIELNGLFWHGDGTKENELKKYKLCKSSKYKFLMFFEDEWLYKQDICKNIIKNYLGINKYKPIRPKKCKIKLIPYKLSCNFYNKFHVQGGCKSKYHIGIFYKKQLICCMSIRKPSRLNSGDWEISRMCSDFEYKVHGIWSYILSKKHFKKLFKGKLVTFSDNRLFNGNVYEKMGMSFIKNIRRDYFWVKGYDRSHKSKLRKTKKEKLGNKTEVKLREDQGFHRIWDLGKIKWEKIIE